MVNEGVVSLLLSKFAHDTNYWSLIPSYRLYVGQE